MMPPLEPQAESASETTPTAASSTASRPADRTPRIVCYHQTQWDGERFISMLPLSRGGRKTTHVILAAIHINEDPNALTLNDDPWDAPKYVRVWQEAKMLQSEGVKVLGMLGGAAKGSYTRLDTKDDMAFYDYYEPLCQMIAKTGLDGLDLDVEEEMSLSGIVRLIDQLKRDFGAGFIITLAPVAFAMMGLPHLSGFDYEELEAARGDEINFYNTQFYNGWGYVEDTSYWDEIMKRGWPAEKIVLGVLTNPEGGRGWVPDEVLRGTLDAIRSRHPNFGGVMGWEYFNSITVAAPFGWPWSWADLLTDILCPSEAQTAPSREQRSG